MNISGKEQVVALRAHLGMSLRRIAAECGLSTPQTLYDIKKDKHGFSREVVAKLCARWPELSSSWLLLGKGDMLDGGKTPALPAPSKKIAPEMQEEAAPRIPLLPVSAYAGPLNAFISRSVRLGECEMVTPPITGAELALRVSGDSMEPVLQDGALVYIKRINDKAFIPWGQTMVLDTENGAFIKDLYPGKPDETVIARSKNAKYPDMVIPFSSVFGIYRVLGTSKSYALL